MRHPGFRICILLAANGVALSESMTWSYARREAALIVLGEGKGGNFNPRTWQMEWPK